MRTRVLRPQIVVAESDHRQLLALASGGQNMAAESLLSEMERARVVADDKLPADVVRMGSGVQYRTDKAGIIHATIGRASFESSALESNMRALIEALNRARPASAKGIYLRKVAVSSTMGVGVKVDTASIAAGA